MNALIELPTLDDPGDALAAVVALRRLADRIERAAVEQAIGEGWTWAETAQALGITRQAAHKKHSHHATSKRKRRR